MSNKEKNDQRIPLQSHQTADFAKRFIAVALGKVFNRLGVAHTESFSQGHSEGQKKGYSAGYAAGLTTGHASGFTDGRVQGLDDGREEGRTAGYVAGHAAGLEAGKRVLEILDRRSRPRAVPGVDDRLFDDWSLLIDDNLKARVRHNVQQKLPAYKQPTEDQWRMIFSTTPSTCVVAGAGSGKSTTLVLRILVLHHYMGFELSSLTVVTFTNMSRYDFIKKLRETFELWKIEVSFKEAKTVVWTFHSKILRFVRGLPSYDRVVPFEFCGEGLAKAEEAVEEDDDDIVPFETRLSAGQFDLLNAAYSKLYREDTRFRELMQIMYQRSFTLRMLDANSDQVQQQVRGIRYASRDDAACMDAVESAWREAGKWPIAGIEAQRMRVTVNGFPFQLHGKLADRDVYVVLGPDKIPGATLTRPGAGAAIGREMGRKQTIFRAYCEVPVIWLQEPNAASGFIKWLADGATTAPGFDYQLSGELGAVNLLECFVGVASFMENLGLDVPATIASMKLLPSDPDRGFFEALGIFWPTFEQYLGEQHPRVMTFNRMFSLFSESSPRNLRLVGSETLRSMSHLMIDEFQDISPQIVSWVRATLLEIRRRGSSLYEGRDAKHSSLLCVGDDWQSIYGWRGSSPKFFMEFESEFKASANTSVMLSENYRSHQFVIDAAEHVVRGAPAIPGKKARAAGSAASDPVPVEIHDRDDQLLIKLVHEHYDAGRSVMVLYRRGEDGKTIKALLTGLITRDSKLPAKKQRLKLLTYHRSKGLEADSVFLIGDCVHLIDSPYKNQAYLAAKLGPKGDAAPFDTSQRQEILRLAYVAITRAARYCYWFIDASPAADTRPRASTHVAAGTPFFIDRRRG